MMDAMHEPATDRAGADRAPGPAPRALPTMSDVARRAGVSRQLVSLVLRDAPGPAPASRAAVLAAAAELGYRVNTSARLLRQGRTGRVGVLYVSGNSFQAACVEHLVEAAQADGLAAVLGPMTARRDTDAVVTDLLGHRVEALACFNPDPAAPALRQAVELLPVVWLGERVDDPAVDAVRSDDTTGLRLAVEHLVGLGHREVAFAGGLGRRAGPDRAAAYREAMTAAGLADHVDEVAVGFDEESGATAARRLLGRRHLPTAVVCAGDDVAAGLVAVLRLGGVRVPADVSVVGYDDSRAAALSYLDLTSVRQDPATTARTALDVAASRRARPSLPPRDVCTPVTLTVRGSTAPSRHL